MTRLGLLAGVAMTLMGCAEPLHLVDRRASAGVSPYSFWPPPPGSTLWLPPTSPATTSAKLAAVALELETSLVKAGYAEARWYSIGSDCQHGFAVTTRLERQDSDPASPSRWSTLYPEPAGLRWLTFALTPALPDAAPYRAFLIAFTDLPMPSRGAAAPIWNEQTLMDGPGAPERRSVAPAAEQRRTTPRYRFGVYEYRYDWDAEEQRGTLRAAAGTNLEHAWPSPLGSF